jgi:tRNA (guanine37-N1)-methyltransferase
VRIDVVTIFPAYLNPLELSLVGRARATGLLDVRVHDLREWASDAHRSVDDTPYGGGAGMIMRPEPWGDALDALFVSARDAAGGAAGGAAGAAGDGGGGAAGDGGGPRLIVPTPSGVPFTQRRAEEFATEPWLVLACGRYEGIDARVVEYARTRMRVDEISIGDYILGGGEAAALVIVEAVARLLPGVLGNPDSLAEESHVAGILEYPGYTKPASWRGYDVPGVLLSGHHAAIARWRRDQALRLTAQRRPDLVARLDPAVLDPADRALLATLGWHERDGGFSYRPPPVAD